ncbi:hypothetical protein [Spirosoma spitsbergense]|uniref:hypothetical protein n=1 Tax=Spirosoma spitsbergense TaxID=431554 RepID=UPI00036958ED|nr:hypothetical protein [Spirosoma spitsbergense]
MYINTNVSISRVNPKKGTVVYLSKDLPVGFGAVSPLPKGTKGYILTDGFVGGELKVDFPMRGTALFHSFVAGDYLECDAMPFM